MSYDGVIKADSSAFGSRKYAVGFVSFAFSAPLLFSSQQNRLQSAPTPLLANLQSFVVVSTFLSTVLSFSAIILGHRFGLNSIPAGPYGIIFSL